MAVGLMHRPPIDPYVFSEAVAHFWFLRTKSAEDQAARGISDQGARSQVTGGNNMIKLPGPLTVLMTEIGAPRDQIFTIRRTIDLPGYYRPAKDWDLVVKHDDKLVAAIEMKSHVGPSFGNNFNNRTEEAIGNAVDLWTAYREGAFRASPQPWLGWLMLVEDAPASRRKGLGVRETHFPVLPEFRGTSYIDRYIILCDKLVRERQYNAACLLTAARERARLPHNYDEPSPDFGAVQFITQLLAHVSASFASRG
jgi:hypothetical protein